MDIKALASNFKMLQPFVAGASFFSDLKYHVVAFLVLAVTGIAFLLSGLYLYLITILPPYQVCLIMGGVIFALALVVLGVRLLVLYMIKRRITRAMNDIYTASKSIVSELTTELTDDMKDPIAANPKISIGVAFLIGFVLFSRLFGKNS